jgi:hypothetical protein
MYNYSFDEEIEELKFGQNTYRQAWQLKKERNPTLREYDAIDMVNDQVKTYKLSSDVCLINSLENCQL